MIGALVSVISLNLTLTLVQDYGVIAGTFTISNVTLGTPILLTVPNHGVPLGRVVHAIVSGILGTVEANGLWILTPVDSSTFALSTLTAQGLIVPSVGTHTYVSGGLIQYAFPDYQILLGRRNMALSSSVASPRIVFVPTTGREWAFESYGGIGSPAPFTVNDGRGTLEQQAEKLQPQIATEFSTFEIYVTGSANPPSPDYGDFDAVQQIVHALYGVLFDASGGARAKVLKETWPSQLTPAAQAATGTMSQRGQQWAGVIELQQPVTKLPLQFVPIGTYSDFIVQPEDPLIPEDQTVITFAPP